MAQEGTAQEAARARRRAILCVLGSSASYTVAAALVKFAAPRIPVWEIVLFRSLGASVCLLPLLRAQGGWAALRTRRPWGTPGGWWRGWQACTARSTAMARCRSRR